MTRSHFFTRFLLAFALAFLAGPAALLPVASPAQAAEGVRYAYNWRGTYSASTQYITNDLVGYGGSVYRARVASAGQTPSTSSNYWEVFVQKGTDGSPTGYASLTTLKAATPANGDRALLQDYGIYRYSSASTATANDSNVILPASGSGRWLLEVPGVTFSREYNVRDFGALGDGATDDTTAIQAALTAVAATGGRLTFPKGTYKTAGGTQTGTSCLALTGASNVELYGDGAVIHTGAGTARTLLIHSSSRVTVRGLKIIGYTGVLAPSAENHACLVVSNGSSDVTITDCYFTNTLGDCVYIGGDITNGSTLGQTSKRVSISRCVLKSRYGNGVASSSSGSKSRWAVAATDCDGLSITDNTIYGALDMEPNANYQGVRFATIQGNRCLAGPVRPQAVIGSSYNADEAIVDNGGLAAPTAAPTMGTATSGGAIAAGTYYACFTYYNSQGETARSPESAGQVTTGSTSTITVTGGAIPSGATGVKIYLTPTSLATGTEVLAGSYTSGTSATITALPAASADWPPTLLGNNIAFTGVSGTSDTNHNAVRGNYIENGLISCGTVYASDILDNVIGVGGIVVGSSTGGGTSGVTCKGNVIKKVLGSLNAAIKVENVAASAFTGNVCDSAASKYMFELVSLDGRCNFGGNVMGDNTASGMFTGSLIASDAAWGNVVSGTASRPNSTAQTGNAWMHNVSEVTLTGAGTVLAWTDYRTDCWNLGGNGYTLDDVTDIPDGTLLTIRSAAYGGSTVTILHNASKIKMADGANYVTTGGECITFLAYSGVLYEVARSYPKWAGVRVVGMGRATLVGGQAVVSNANVTANSNILLTSQVDGGVPGFLRIVARNPGTSFTIQSSDAGDTCSVAWVMLEP